MYWAQQQKQIAQSSIKKVKKQKEEKQKTEQQEGKANQLWAGGSIADLFPT
jgi:hypothetical protein